MKFEHVEHSFPSLLQENNGDGTRCYVTPNGLKYPSVTTVLAEYSKKGIDAWKKKVGEVEAEKVSRTAAQRGTGVHKLAEDYLNNLGVPQHGIMPNQKSVFVNLRKELDKLNKIHCLEQRLFSHELQLAGTVDCIAEYNGVLSVIDFKTSRRLKKKDQIANYFMQGSAYAKMFSEMTGIKVEQTVIMIGVDGVDFCQVMKEDPDNHMEDLIKYINNHRERTQNG